MPTAYMVAFGPFRLPSNTPPVAALGLEGERLAVGPQHELVINTEPVTRLVCGATWLRVIPECRSEVLRSDRLPPAAHRDRLGLWRDSRGR